MQGRWCHAWCLGALFTVVQQSGRVFRISCYCTWMWYYETSQTRLASTAWHHRWLWWGAASVICFASSVAETGRWDENWRLNICSLFFLKTHWLENGMLWQRRHWAAWCVFYFTVVDVKMTIQRATLSQLSEVSGRWSSVCTVFICRRKPGNQRGLVWKSVGVSTLCIVCFSCSLNNFIHHKNDRNKNKWKEQPKNKNRK